MASQTFTSSGLYPELGANAYGESTLTVPAAKSTSEHVLVMLPSSLSTNYVYCGARVSGAGEVTVGYLNNAGTSQGTGYSTSDTFRGIIWST